MAISDRGFAHMPKERVKEIASLGGRRAHLLGKAHEWDATAAREAGRKGGLVSGARKRAKVAQA